MINIGQYIEVAINWTMVHFSTFFDAVNAGIGSFIIGFQHVLFGIPFYITILVLAALACHRAAIWFNWNLSYNNLYMHKKQYIYENTLNPKFTQFIFSLHKMFSYISLPHQVFPLSKLQNH